MEQLQEQEQIQLPQDMINVIISLNHETFQFVNKQLYFSTWRKLKEKFIEASRYGCWNTKTIQITDFDHGINSNELVDICISTLVTQLEVNILRCDRMGCDILLIFDEITIRFHKKRTINFTISHIDPQTNILTSLSLDRQKNLNILQSHKYAISKLARNLPQEIKRVIFNYVFSGYSNKWKDVKVMLVNLTHVVTNYSGNCKIKLSIDAYKTHRVDETDIHQNIHVNEVVTNEKFQVLL